MRRYEGTTARRVAGIVLSVALAALPTGRLAAQILDTVPKPRIPATLRTGKWIALTGAVALGLAADQKHRAADRAYNELRFRCFDLPDSCILGPGNSYIDPTSEALFQDTKRFDHQATRLLIGAEVAFVGAAAGFIWELMHRRDRPPTIPFEPHITPAASATHVGLTVRF